MVFLREGFFEFILAMGKKHISVFGEKISPFSLERENSACFF